MAFSIFGQRVSVYCFVAILVFETLFDNGGAIQKERVNEVLGLFIENPDMTCKDLVAEMSKKQMTAVKECTKQLNFKNAQDKKERSACVLKCVMTNEGLLASDGQFNEGLVRLMKRISAPPQLKELKDKAVEMFEDCRQKTPLDNDDKTCKSYGLLIKCLLNIMSLCK